MDLFEALRPNVQSEFAGRRGDVTRHLFVSRAAAMDLAKALAAEVTGRRVVLLADARTAGIGLGPCRDALVQEGFTVMEAVLPDMQGQSPSCDDVTKDMLQAGLPAADAIVGIGSGVVSDLVKWLAFERSIPAAIYATAASMNGYTAANVAPAIAGVKSLVAARSHRIVAADPQILAAAPRELTAAGLGDVIAKWVSTVDWRMNHRLFDEPFSEAVAGIIDDVEQTYLGRPAAIAEGCQEAVSGLFSALIFSGCAMTLQGSSMPASGGEHLISHALDMKAMAQGTTHDLHGRQVGLGTVVAAALLGRSLSQEAPAFSSVDLPLDRSGWGALADSVAPHHRQKLARHQQAVSRLREPGVWKALREELSGTFPTPQKVKEVLRAAGAAHRISDLKLRRAQFEWAVLNGAQMRGRFTSLDLAWVTGVLPRALPAIIDGYLDFTPR